jgi:hypothetical protein
MQNIIMPENYEEAKRKAKELYGNINQVWSPAIGGYVIFNQAGFKHLVRRSGVQRPKSEQKRRFVLLFYIEEILTDHTATFVHETKDIEGAMTELWIFSKSIDIMLITVVVRRIGSGKIHFFSIYAKNKNLPQG